MGEEEKGVKISKSQEIDNFITLLIKFPHSIGAMNIDHDMSIIYIV